MIINKNEKQTIETIIDLLKNFSVPNFKDGNFEQWTIYATKLASVSQSSADLLDKMVKQSTIKE